MTTGRANNITVGTGLNGALVGSVFTINANASTGLAVTWSGPAPTVSGPGLEARIPRIAGASFTFTLDLAVSRLNVLPVGSTVFRVEKSPGGGAFSATTVTTLTHTTADWEKTSSSLSAFTVTTGDLLRIYFVTMAASGGTYELQLTGV